MLLRRRPESGCTTAPCWCPETDQHSIANTWKFMLFCARATQHKSQKLQLPSCAATRKPFELLCVGNGNTVLVGAPNDPQHAPRNSQHRRNTVNSLCFCTCANNAQTRSAQRLSATGAKHCEFMCFCVVGRNRGAPRRHVAAPKRTCIQLPTRGNSCCFAPGRSN